MIVDEKVCETYCPHCKKGIKIIIQQYEDCITDWKIEKVQ